MMDHVYSEKQREKINLEYNWIKDKCYLDNAGSALYSSTQVQNIADDLCTNLYANPHSLNDASRSCTDAIDRIRYRVLEFFHTTPEEYSVVFTSGATASIKLLLESFSWNDELSGTYVYTASNHTSVVGGRQLAVDGGANIICLDDLKVEQLMNKPLEEQLAYYPSNSLFAFPAQCNFSGKKFPLEWVSLVQNGVLNNRPELDYESSRWYTLLDAAAYCSTSDLNLTQTSPDFVCLSFYKIFGYPTGLGALLVKNSSAAVLKKRYFGGGSVDIALPSRQFHEPRKQFYEWFEDGTLPYLSIISLGHGFDCLSRFRLSMKEISLHVFTLAKSVVSQMKSLKHWNAEPLVEIYADSNFSDCGSHGGIVAFNLKRSDGSYIGYIEVLHVANSYKIQLRTGCFCNLGACQRYLSISDEQLIANYQSGHVCGDDRDIIKGRPTGAVRVSFGLANSQKDVTYFIRMLQETFLETDLIKEPSNICSLESKKPILNSIRLYPIKSCAPLKVDSWLLTSRGLFMDRQWMIITSAGVCLTQKQEPMLCRVMPSVSHNSQILTITYNGTDPIHIDEKKCNIDAMYYLCRNKVCGDVVDGVDCGDEVAAWLSRHLLRDGLRLVRQHEDDTRTSKNDALRERDQGKLSLVNQAQYLVINLNSVDWLRHRLRDESDFNLTTLEDRFRANLIISGVSAFDEMKWKRVKIGPVEFQVEGPCTRCQMICIDQQTGEKNRKPLVELSRALEGKLRFGIYCSHLNVQSLSSLNVGDAVTFE